MFWCNFKNIVSKSILLVRPEVFSFGLIWFLWNCSICSQRHQPGNARSVSVGSKFSWSSDLKISSFNKLIQFIQIRISVRIPIRFYWVCVYFFSRNVNHKWTPLFFWKEFEHTKEAPKSINLILFRFLSSIIVLKSFVVYVASFVFNISALRCIDKQSAARSRYFKPLLFCAISWA